MDVRCQQFLSGAGFSDQQHSRIGSGDERSLFDCMLENRTRSDHPGAFAYDFTKSLILAPQLALLQSVFDHDQNFVAAERLLQKIECARANCVNRIGDRSVAGDHHNGNAIVVVSKEAQEIDAVAVRQSHIEKAYVRTISKQSRSKLIGSPADENVVALPLEDHLEGKADVWFVVENENAFTRHCV